MYRFSYPAESSHLQGQLFKFLVRLLLFAFVCLVMVPGAPERAKRAFVNIIFASAHISSNKGTCVQVLLPG